MYIHLKHFFDVLFPVHVMEGFDDLVMADTRVFHEGIKQFLDLIGNSIKCEHLTLNLIILNSIPKKKYWLINAGLTIFIYTYCSFVFLVNFLIFLTIFNTWVKYCQNKRELLLNSVSMKYQVITHWSYKSNYYKWIE